MYIEALLNQGGHPRIEDMIEMNFDMILKYREILRHLRPDVGNDDNHEFRKLKNLNLRSIWERSVKHL